MGEWLIMPGSTANPYRAQDALIASARLVPGLDFLLLGLLVAAGVAFGLGQSLLGVMKLVMSADGYADALSVIHVQSTPWSVALVLLSGGFVGVGALTAAKLVQGRAPFSVLGPLPTLSRHFAMTALGPAAFMLAMALLPPYGLYGDLLPGQRLPVWAAWLPVTLLVILFQSAGEEILFRGYLQQQLAARFAAPAVWMTIPAALFALGHFDPQADLAKACLVVVWAFLFGLAMADITARAGTLGPAIALHFVNNLVALLFVAVPGPMSGLALRVMAEDPYASGKLDAFLILDLACLACLWLIARLLLRR
jgi:membrane protease YdiL (CAAX protease family)